MGLCHAVMSGIAPQCPIVDLSHLVRPLEVTSAAILLADAMPYVHESSVVLAVVDPNVGKDREVAIETESGRHLVGPDNGLLSLAWDAAGGIRSAVELTSTDVVRRPHAESFRAPDTLCPAAASLASGMPIEQLGTPLDPTTLAVVVMAEPEIEAGKITCEVIDFNRFGNVHLNVRSTDLDAAGLDAEPMLSIEAVSGSAAAKRGNTYADFAAGEYGVRHSGVKDRGFMDSIYFDDPLGLLIELASYRFEPPAGHTHADVLLEAHRLRIERDDYNIAAEHLADAIERLVARSQDSLSDDRSPRDPYRS